VLVSFGKIIDVKLPMPRNRALGRAVKRYPRPLQNPLPIWVGVGVTPESFVRAGTLGLQLMVAIIGGEFKRFRPLIELYREAGRRAGHSAEKLIVGLHAIGFLGDTTQEAADDFYPGYAHTFTKIGKERGWPPRLGHNLTLCVAPQVRC
jgi:alkanesulfonate monooxygenase SsuD/methylene tetrahydromethanopterin reductase-like flavin-dependent oxidoreductase (luciferase family)